MPDVFRERSDRYAAGDNRAASSYLGGSHDVTMTDWPPVGSALVRAEIDSARRLAAEFEQRIAMAASWHYRKVSLDRHCPGHCNECGWTWPCETARALDPEQWADV